MKNRMLSKVLIGMVVIGMLTGCGMGTSENASAQSTTNETAISDLDGNLSEADMAAYKKLQEDYDELLDYTIFLEQELVRLKSQYAETNAMMDDFVEANESGNKIILVEPVTIEDTEKSIEEKSE